MKCKKHPIDQSSHAGVCASCLRERLIEVIATQIEAQKEAVLRQAQQDCRKSDAQRPKQPPFVFPRSASPYVSHRKSDSGTTCQIRGHHRRFYSTPQVGPNGLVNVAVDKDKKSLRGKFSSVLYGLFRSKSDKSGADTDRVSYRGVSVDSLAAPPSWYSIIIPVRRKKQIRAFSVNEYSDEVYVNTSRVLHRGMSPARSSNVEDDERCRDLSSGYSSESAQGWKQTPRKTPATRRCGGRTAVLSRNMSSFAFCLSPLVRPSPNRKWHHKVSPPEMVAAGEVRAPAKPQLSTQSSFCKSRSRKLADFGRQSYAGH